MPDAFIEARADMLVKVDELSADKRDAYVARYIDLIDTPEDRDEQMALDALAYLHERTLDETGSEEYADKYIEQIGEYLELTWAEIHSVDLPTRGNNWTQGRALVSALAARQALVEAVMPDAMALGEKMGQINAQAASRMSTAQKVKAARDGGIKETIKQRSSNDG